MARPRSLPARLSVQHQGLVAIAELALTNAPVDEVIRQSLELLQRAVRFDHGAFYWWDSGRRAMLRAVSVGTEAAASRLDDGSLLARAVAERKPLEALVEAGDIAVPVLVRGQLLGAFAIARRDDPFTSVDRDFVTQFVRQASLPIENARLLRQMRQSEEQYRSLFEACLDVVYMSTPGGLFLDVNPAGQSLFGHASHEDLLLADIGLDLYEDPADREDFKRVMAEHGFVRDREARLRRSDGQVLTVVETATAVRDEQGAVIAYRGILRDVSVQKRAQEALAHQALHDGLTGLPNRILLHDRLQQAIRAAVREHGSAALLLMDLDRFKEVNDTLGHAVGDLLLVEVSRRLQLALRPGDTVARLGGDEFAVVLPGTNAVGAAVAARRLLTAVDLPFSLGDLGMDLDVRGSVGVAAYPEHGHEPDQLLQRADVAMYVAKRSALGLSVYTPQHDEHSPTRLALVGELRRAIDQRGLVLYYQPQVSLRTGELLGAEGLVRWPHPQRGLVPPDQFVPLAEQTGLIRPLTDWVIESALRQGRDWQRSGLEVPVAVNLSMRDLQDPRLPDTIATLLRAYGAVPSLLRVEITESMLMADPPRVIDVLADLRAIGVRIAIDDFGTGYSSLAYLADLPVDSLKIDRSFVQRLGAGQRHAAIVRSTIELAHELGLQVVAEGIEDRATWDALEALGCDSAQGYFIAKPMPAHALPAWLDLAQAA